MCEGEAVLAISIVQGAFDMTIRIPLVFLGTEKRQSLSFIARKAKRSTRRKSIKVNWTVGPYQATIDAATQCADPLAGVACQHSNQCRAANLPLFSIPDLISLDYPVVQTSTYCLVRIPSSCLHNKSWILPILVPIVRTESW